MKLTINFDWTKVISPIEHFVEMSPRGGHIAITTDKLEDKWIQISQGGGLTLNRNLRNKAYEFMIPLFETHGLYSIRQISDSTNIYLSHSGGDPIVSTARIFECSSSEILKMDFIKQSSEGLFEHNRGFVPEEFFRGCAKIEQLMEQLNKGLEYILHMHSPGAETLFTNEEFVELFAYYVVPVSRYFYDECFYNPLTVTQAGLA